MGEFLARVLESLLKTGLSLIKNEFKPLANIDLIPLGLTAAAAAANSWIDKKSYNQSDNIINFKWRNRCYHENTYISSRIWIIDKKC